METTYITLCIIGIILLNVLAFSMLQYRRTDKNLTKYLKKGNKNNKFRT